ncbi:MAG: protoporphyrinogen oxidase HemJ [Alphaproteobacteria bacterium]|nr:protoporphyrinogen oxidase HemJ [Alphaproteobacteria bacterium]
MTEFYPWIKAAHVISVMSWMAGMLYLPRLFVYHADAAPGSELSETLKLMERRLLRFIINPAMIASFLFGLWMLLLDPVLLEQSWMWVKLLALVGLTGVHGALARWRRFFERDANMLPARTYRIVNELPTLLMAIIVVLVIVRPF